MFLKEYKINENPKSKVLINRLHANTLNTCKWGFQPNWPCTQHLAHMAMDYKDLVFQHSAGSGKRSLCDNQDPEHIPARNQWLYQALESTQAHTWLPIKIHMHLFCHILLFL